MFCFSLKRRKQKQKVYRVVKRLLSFVTVFGLCLYTLTVHTIITDSENSNIRMSKLESVGILEAASLKNSTRHIRTCNVGQLSSKDHQRSLLNTKYERRSTHRRNTRWEKFADTGRFHENDVGNLDTINKKAVRRLPQAIIIGVKKCGTRALLEYLRIHPDIRAPGPEPHFFDRNYHLGLDWYRQKMPPAIEGQITMEKTPRYFVTQEAPARIANMSKDIKLVIVVRDPVTRAISDFTQGSSKGPTTTETFTEKAFHKNGSGGVHKNWSAIKTGIYIRHIHHWLKYFSKTQMHFVSGENLISNPAQEVLKVTDFLNLKRVISDEHFYFNETKGFPCLKKHEGRPETKCFNSSKGRQHSHVDMESIDKLKQFFKPYNEEFYQLVGQDFGW